MIFVIMSCDSVASESRITAEMCFKMQKCFPGNSNERRELLWLANETSVNIVRFTAAEFFEINRGTVFGILSTTTTYFIIIVQFKNIGQN
jgi:gustatory receptor